MGQGEVDREGLLRILYVSIFLTSTGLGTAAFMLPVYAAGLGAGYAELGVLGAVRSGVYTMMTLTVGLLLDRRERVGIYLGFMAVGAAVVAGFAFIGGIQLLVAWGSLLGLVSACFWVPASTLTADISPPERLSESMGRYNLSWMLGFIVGPTLGGYAAESIGYPAVYVTLAAIIAVSAAVVAFRIRPAIRLRNRGGSGGFSLSPLRGLAPAYVTLVPFTLILGIYMAIMPGHLKLMGLTPGLVGLLLTLTNGVRGVGFFNAPRFAKLGVRTAIPVASMLLSAAMLIFGRADSLALFAAPLAMYGLAAGIMTPLMLNYIAQRCDKSSLGAAMGLHECFYGIGMCFGPLIGGAVAEVYSPQLLYTLLALLALALLPLSRVLEPNTAK